MQQSYAGDAEVTKCWAGPDIGPSTTPWRSSAGATRGWSIGPVGPYVIANRQDVIIGSTGLDVETAHRAATGYVLARDAWGQGYATEATRAMANLADQLGIGRLYALCHPDNRASVRVLEKAGFSFEGVLRRHTVFPNLDPTMCARRRVLGATRFNLIARRGKAARHKGVTPTAGDIPEHGRPRLARTASCGHARNGRDDLFTDAVISGSSQSCDDRRHGRDRVRTHPAAVGALQPGHRPRRCRELGGDVHARRRLPLYRPACGRSARVAAIEGTDELIAYAKVHYRTAKGRPATGTPNLVIDGDGETARRRRCAAICSPSPPAQASSQAPPASRGPPTKGGRRVAFRRAPRCKRRRDALTRAARPPTGGVLDAGPTGDTGRSEVLFLLVIGDRQRMRIADPPAFAKRLRAVAVAQIVVRPSETGAGTVDRRCRHFASRSRVPPSTARGWLERLSRASRPRRGEQPPLEIAPASRRAASLTSADPVCPLRSRGSRTHGGSEAFDCVRVAVMALNGSVWAEQPYCRRRRGR